MMHFHTFGRLAAALLVAVSALGAAATAQVSGKDKVYKVNSDKPLLARVADQTLSEVVVSIDGGGTIKISWNEVDRIVFGDGYRPFRNAQEALDKGAFADAIKEIQDWKPGREIFAPLRLLLLGRALEGLDKAKEAEEAYAQLVAEHAKSHYVRMAIRTLVDLQVRNKNFVGAVDTAERGIKLGKDLKLDGIAQEFLFVKARVLEAQDKLTEANREYQTLATSAAQSAPRIASLATAAQGRIAARQGDVPKARMLLEPLIQSTDAAILGPAYAALGDTLYAQGVKETNAEKLREGLLHYLRAEVQFPPVTGESTDTLEMALFGSARTYKKLSEIDKPKETSDFWKQKGLEKCADFLSRFPGSSLAASVTTLRGEFK